MVVLKDCFAIKCLGTFLVYKKFWIHFLYSKTDDIAKCKTCSLILKALEKKISDKEEMRK